MLQDKIIAYFICDIYNEIDIYLYIILKQKINIIY